MYEHTGFRVPISFMVLDDKPELLNYITEREKYVGKPTNKKSSTF